MDTTVSPKYYYCILYTFYKPLNKGHSLSIKDRALGPKVSVINGDNYTFVL